MRTIGTQPLSPGETWAALAIFVELSRQQGVTELRVAYGWGCRAPQIDVQPVVAVGELGAWLRSAIDQDHYTLGEDNLHFRASAPALELLLCHERDVHFKTDDAAQLNVMRAQWQSHGYRVWRD